MNLLMQDLMMEISLRNPSHCKVLSECEDYCKRKKPPQRGPIKVLRRRLQHHSIIFNPGETGIQVPGTRKRKHRDHTLQTTQKEHVVHTGSIEQSRFFSPTVLLMASHSFGCSRHVLVRRQRPGRMSDSLFFTSLGLPPTIQRGKRQ